MFTKYCFDAFLDNDSNFALGQKYAFEDKEIYDDYFNKINQILNDRTTKIPDKSAIYFSHDVVERIIPYKLEKYCYDNNINLEKIVQDYTEANVLITEPLLATQYINSCLTSLVYLVKIKDFPNLKRESVYEVKGDEYVALSQTQLDLIDNIQFIPLEKKLVKLIWIDTNGRFEASTHKHNPYHSLFYFLNKNLPIIHIDNFIYDIHNSSVEIDEDMVDTLIGMIDGKDNESYLTALNIIADCNREKSIPYLLIMWYLYRDFLLYKGEINIAEYSRYMKDRFGLRPTSKQVIGVLKEELPPDKVKHLIQKYSL